MVRNEVLVVVICGDSLMNSLSKHNSARASGKSKIQYEYFSGIPSKAKLQECDAIIYDLDIAKDTREDLLRINRESDVKPLVVTGHRQIIAEVKASSELKPLIDRAQAKPVSIPAFEMAVSTVLANQPAPQSWRQASHQVPQIKKPIALAAGSFLGLLIVAAIGYSIFSSEPKATPAENIISEATLPVNQAVTLPALDSKGIADKETSLSIDNTHDETEKLVSLAKSAYEVGRIALPENDSALHYYKQALLIDRYKTEAYQGLQTTLIETRQSVSQLIDTGKLRQAEDLLAVLTETSPFDRENDALLARYKEAALIAASQLQNTDDNPEGDTEIISSTQTDDLKEESREFNFSIIESAQAGVENESLEIPNASAANLTWSTDFPTKTILDSSEEPNLSSDEKIASLEDSAVKDISETVSASQTPAIVLSRPNPKYPKRLASLGIEGWVEVSYQVNEKGEVINAKAVDGQPKNMFSTAGLRAIKRWKFQPAKNATTGENVSSEEMITKFTFKAS